MQPTGLSRLAAAGTALGHITLIKVANDYYAVLFQLDKPITGSPHCNESQQFSIHLQKPGGMATYMAVLQAKREGYILVEGLNHCSYERKSEDVSSVVLQ